MAIVYWNRPGRGFFAAGFAFALAAGGSRSAALPLGARSRSAFFGASAALAGGFLALTCDLLAAGFFFPAISLSPRS